LFEQLAKEKPQAASGYWVQLAIVRSNQCRSLRRRRQFHEAELSARQALHLLDALSAEAQADPDARWIAVKCRAQLGKVLQDSGRKADAEREYRAAAEHCQRLAADFPRTPRYRQYLAEITYVLAGLLSQQHRFDEAEKTYQAALDRQRQLVADFPKQLTYRADLAKSYQNLGNMRLTSERGPEAEAALHQALAHWEQLVTERPTEPVYRTHLGRTLNSLASLWLDIGRPQDAEQAFSRARNLFQKLVEEFDTVGEYHYHFAVVLSNLAILARKRTDWNAACRLLEQALREQRTALAGGPNNPRYRGFCRDLCWTLAELLVQAGRHVAATDVIAEPPRLFPEDGATHYRAAVLLVRCQSLAQKDPNLTASQRMERAEIYADRAVVLVREALANGYRDAGQVKTDPALAPLRSREDFQNLFQGKPGSPD
jgi:tetratricopeptide (TPR) repeat protein